MKGELQFTEYTRGMYLGVKSKYWSYLNNLRIKKFRKVLSSYANELHKIIEFGAYDLFFFTQVSDVIIEKKCSKYTFTDLYNTTGIVNIAESNMAILQSDSTIQFNLIPSKGEEISNKTKELYDAIFIFETLEHVLDEKRVIESISKILNRGGLVFVGAPQEFGIMLFLKEMGRLIVIGKKNHSFKEIFYATFGKMSRVKRVAGDHQGYDYRETKNIFQNAEFEHLGTHNYPNKIFSYGTIMVFKKPSASL